MVYDLQYEKVFLLENYWITIRASKNMAGWTFAKKSFPNVSGTFKNFQERCFPERSESFAKVQPGEIGDAGIVVLLIKFN